MPEGQVLEFAHVTKRFGAITAVSDLSVRVEPGVVTGFLGPNGAGKTTSLRMLLGQIRPTSGTATIGGLSYGELRYPLQTIGAVLEEAAYRPRRTAVRQLMILAKANGIPASRVDEVLRLVGLQGDAETRIGGYSLGMRQRLSVATALLGDPGALVLDEPANGLDPEGIRWMRLLMRRLADEGRTVLVSSHVLSEIEQVADDVVVLSKGTAMYAGSIEDLADPTSGAVVVDADDRPALAAALRAAGLPFDVLRSGLTVRGSDAATVGAAAATAGVALSMLQQRGPSLEEVFLDLVYGRRSESPRLDEVANPVAHAPLTLDGFGLGDAAADAGGIAGSEGSVSDVSAPDGSVDVPAGTVVPEVGVVLPDAAVEGAAGAAAIAEGSDDAVDSDDDGADAEDAAASSDDAASDADESGADEETEGGADASTPVFEADGAELPSEEQPADAVNAQEHDQAQEHDGAQERDEAQAHDEAAGEHESHEGREHDDAHEGSEHSTHEHEHGTQGHEHGAQEHEHGTHEHGTGGDDHDGAGPGEHTDESGERAYDGDAREHGDAQAELGGNDDVSREGDDDESDGGESGDHAGDDHADEESGVHAEYRDDEHDASDDGGHDASDDGGGDGHEGGSEHGTDGEQHGREGDAEHGPHAHDAGSGHPSDGEGPQEEGSDGDGRSDFPLGPLPLATSAVSVPKPFEPTTFTELITGIPSAHEGDGAEPAATEAISIVTPAFASEDDADSVVDDADDPRLAAMRTTLSAAASRFFNGDEEEQQPAGEHTGTDEHRDERADEHEHDAEEHDGEPHNEHHDQHHG